MKLTGNIKLLDSIKPDGWRVHRIDDLATRGTGHTPDKEVPAYWDGDISWVSLTDCDRLDRVYISESTRCITQTGIDNSSAVLHPAGIVLMSRDAGVGKSAITTRPMAVSQHFMTWLCGGQLQNLYLYYWLQLLKPEFERIANGSTIKTIGMPYFSTLGIMCPGESEQQEITRCLLHWDRGIQKLTDLIAAKLRFKQGLMQQLLKGERRFKRFVSSDEKQTTAAGNFPRDWRIRRLSDVTEEVRRKNVAGISRVLTASGNHGLVDQRDYFNRSVAGKSLAGYYHLKRGEFAYNRSLMKGYPYGATKRLNLYDEGVVSTLYLCFSITAEDCDSNWLTHVFESDVFNSQLRGIAKMGARAHGLLNVAASEFFHMILPMPSREEQVEIASTLDMADKEIILLEKQLEGLKQQKKGLMQKLLTGEVRVSHFRSVTKMVEGGK